MRLGEHRLQQGGWSGGRYPSVNDREVLKGIMAERVCRMLARWKGQGDVPTRKPPVLHTVLLASWGMTRKGPSLREVVGIRDD